MIFIDTSFLYPLFNTEDEHHERVRAVFESYRGRVLRDLLVTTPQIIMETITLIRLAARQPGRRDSGARHRQAIYAGERLYGERLARIHRPSVEEELMAFEYFKRHHDQEYSAIDCLSFVVMDKLGITEALAVDSDFTHRFVARPGPR